MRFFIIANFSVHDLAMFERYSAMVGPILARHHGRIRIGAFDVSRSVTTPPSGGVVVEFDSAQAASAFFDAPDYAEAKSLFLASTQPDITFASEAAP